MQCTKQEQIPFVETVLTDIIGQEVSKLQFTKTSRIELEIIGESGLYFLTLKSGEKMTVVKVLKK